MKIEITEETADVLRSLLNSPVQIAITLSDAEKVGSAVTELRLALDQNSHVETNSNKSST